MTSCPKCGVDAKLYDCDHTGPRGLCKVCYGDLHFEMTEP